MKTTCHLCGNTVSACYYEILHRESSVTDRVFLCCYKCIEQIEDIYYEKRKVVKDE